jgi:hypothetical protein
MQQATLPITVSDHRIGNKRRHGAIFEPGDSVTDGLEAAGQAGRRPPAGMRLIGAAGGIVGCPTACRCK